MVFREHAIIPFPGPQKSDITKSNIYLNKRHLLSKYYVYYN